MGGPAASAPSRSPGKRATLSLVNGWSPRKLLGNGHAVRAR
jgi:hypothetical protein